MQAESANTNSAQAFALSRLDVVRAKPGSAFAIHYACNAFNELPAESNPVSSIVAKHIASGKVFTFDSARAGEAPALNEFADFIASNPDAIFVHWNMRDERYGFEAISRRSAAIISRTIPTPDNLDLSATLWALHGQNYADQPRLPNLMRLNGSTSLGMLALDDEIAAREANGGES